MVQINEFITKSVDLKEEVGGRHMGKWSCISQSAKKYAVDKIGASVGERQNNASSARQGKAWLIRCSGILAAVVLTACGGGGGSTTPADAETGGSFSGDPTVPAGEFPRAFVAAGNLVTSVPASTYTVASEELAAFTLLNRERSTCGFGQLAHSPYLDEAAKGHADWAILNHYSGHYQVTGTPAFTGVRPVERVAAAGYSLLGTMEVTDEIFSVFGSRSKSGRGESGTRGLLSAPYHSLGLLREFRDLGISIRNDTEVGSTHGARVTNQYNLAYKLADGAAQMAAGELLTYPCAGITNVNFKLTGEEPSPTPGRDLLTAPIGHPVMFRANPGVNLTVQTISINKTGSSAVALLPTITNTNDTVAIVRANEAFVMPDLPLDQNSTYNVSYTAQLRIYGYGQVLCGDTGVLAQGFAWNGTGCTKSISSSFTFTTGTGG